MADAHCPDPQQPPRLMPLIELDCSNEADVLAVLEALKQGARLFALRGCIIAVPTQGTLPAAQSDPKQFLHDLLDDLHGRTGAQPFGSIQADSTLIRVDQHGEMTHSTSPTDLPTVLQAHFGKFVPGKGIELFLSIRNYSPHMRVRLYLHGVSTVLTVRDFSSKVNSNLSREGADTAGSEASGTTGQAVCVLVWLHAGTPPPLLVQAMLEDWASPLCPVDRGDEAAR